MLDFFGVVGGISLLAACGDFALSLFSDRVDSFRLKIVRGAFKAVAFSAIIILWAVLFST